MGNLFSFITVLLFLVMFFFLAISAVILEKKEDTDEWNRDAPE